MYPLRILFSGYAIFGVTLFILSAGIAIYLLRLKTKSAPTKTLIIFYIFVALSGVSTILSNSVVHWSRMLMPWQDFWIISGGVALTYFAFEIAMREKSNEAKIWVIITSSLALLSLLYCLIFDYYYIFHWRPDLSVSDLFYLLLPINTLIVLAAFFRNAWVIYKRKKIENQKIVIKGGGGFFSINDKEVRTLRNFGLAIFLAFLPGLQTFLHFPPPYGFILTNIGSILAIIALTLVFFNYAPDINSFLAKLVGVTLATVLLIISIFGAIDVYTESNKLNSERATLISTIYEVLKSHNDATIPDIPEIAYIVSWGQDSPDIASSYNLLYVSDPDFDLQTLIDENSSLPIGERGQTLTGEISKITNQNWRFIRRFWSYPEGSTHEDYIGYLFSEEGKEYEIGYASFVGFRILNDAVSKWLILILASSVFILVVFPSFFNVILVKPIGNLLKGVNRVNDGDLDVNIEPQYYDEIGCLTVAFNQMVDSLNEKTLELQDESSRLATLVDQRTQELVEANNELSNENTQRKEAEILLTHQLIYQRALAKCSQSLLQVQNPKKDKTIILDQALETLRSSANASRAYIYQNSTDHELGPTLAMLAEVCAPGIPHQIDNPANQNFPLSALPRDFVTSLSQGINFSGPVLEAFNDSPLLRDILLSQNPPLLSVLMIPIFIQNKWWGFVGFDDCATVREWNEGEITMLQTASEMIGNTIHRWDIELNLKDTLDNLEQRVELRTDELNQTNKTLNLEVQQRQAAQKDLEQRLFIEERLSKISARLLMAEDIRGNITKSLEDLAQILNAGRIVLVEFDINVFGQIKEFIEFHDPKIPAMAKDLIQDYVESLVGLREELHNNEAIFIPDIAEFSESRNINFPISEGFGPRSIVLSPLIIDQRIHGVLGCSVLESTPEAFQKNIRILDLVTSMLTSLLQRQNLIQNLELQVAERTHQLTTFLDMAMLGENASNLNDILQPIIYSIARLVDSDAVCIHIINESQEALVLTAQYGLTLDNIEWLKVVKISPSIHQWMEEDNLYESSEHLENPRSDLGFKLQESFNRFIANQISTGSKSLGILSCFRYRDQSFSSFEKTFITALGDLLGIIVENFRLRLEAKELATVDERQRLAREIHDAISQSVYSLSLFARSASDALEEDDHPKLAENLNDIEKIALQSMRDMRLLLYQLREELSDSDIAYALDIRFKQVENRLGIKTKYHIDKNLFLPEQIQHHIWRIIVESLNNSVKHAEATHVNLNLSQVNNEIILVIEDDGVGFDVDAYSAGMGLKNIRERVEEMQGISEIVSEPGQGTLIRVKVPREDV